MAHFNSVTEYTQLNDDFPTAVFEQLLKKSFLKHTHTGIDLSSGIGMASRFLAAKGVAIMGIEPSSTLRAQARKLDAMAGLRIRYLATSPEDTTLKNANLDFALAAKSYHSFNRSLVIPEVKRILKPYGHFIVIDSDLIKSSLVTATLELIRQYSPHIKLADSDANESLYGFPTEWFGEWNTHNLYMADHWQCKYTVSFSHQGWREKIKTLFNHEEIDRDLAKILKQSYPQQPLIVPYVCSIVVLQNI